MGQVLVSPLPGLKKHSCSRFTHGAVGYLMTPATRAFERLCIAIPLAGAELNLERQKDYGRPIEL
jgi:hypothetical protein